MDEERKETCPDCGEETREPPHPLCQKCNRRFEEKMARAERDGDIVLVTRAEFAKAKGAETLARFEKELKEAQEDNKRFYPRAQTEARAEFKAEGAFTVNRQEFNRRAGKRFGELLGDQDRATEIWYFINTRPTRIASLRRFLSSEEDHESSVGAEELVVAQ